MCDFYSAIVTRDGKIHHEENNSHSGTAEKLGLKNEDFKELKFWEIEWDGHGKVPELNKVVRNAGSMPESVARKVVNHLESLSLALETGTGPLMEFVDVKHQHLIREKKTGVVKWTNGTEEWYKNGQLHREDGPAVKQVDGTEWWYKDGQRHREDGPAIKWVDGTEWWYKNGVFIR